MTEVVKKEDNFQSLKERMTTALATLRQDLVAMQQQDIELLRQLMCIQQTVHALARHGYYARSNSSSALLGPDPQGSWAHVPLCRVSSAPLQRQPTEESTGDEATDCEDELAWSCQSADVTNMMEREELLDSLTPIPAAFTKKRHLHPSVSLLPPPPENRATQTGHRPLSRQASVTGNTLTHKFAETSQDLINHVPSDDKCTTCHSEGDNMIYRNAECKTSDRKEVTQVASPLAIGTKMAPAHFSHYKNILQRSSKIWREIKREQNDEGHIDAKKMAALELFL